MIIITGASGGIGSFLISKYLSREESVSGTYFRTKPEVPYINYCKKVNALNYDEVESFVRVSSHNMGDITLINCIGVTYNSFTHKSDPVRWKEVVDLNLTGVYYFIRAALPLMRERKFGRIINFSSVVAYRPTQGTSAYAASKSALWGLSKSLAAENGSMNITANNINLGYAEKGMAIKDVPDSIREEFLKQIPSRKLCSMEDIFNTVEFIRSTPYLNGISIDLDGAII